MNPAAWRHLIQRPSGIATILLLSLLLVFSGFSCARPTFADAVPTPDPHDCCLHSQRASSTVADPTSPSCHDESCLQALDHHVAYYEFVVNQPDPPTLALLIATGWPSDWRSGICTRSFHSIDPAHPPPLQRSRVLRL